MIEKSITISLIITAFYISMQEGMILNFIPKMYDKIKPTKLSEFIRKPLFSCIICMGGIYSLILHIILYGFSKEMLLIMFLVIGINTLIDKFISHD